MEAMSRYPRHPYQTTIAGNHAGGPHTQPYQGGNHVVHTHSHQSHLPHAYLSLTRPDGSSHNQQPLRNPWISSHQQQQCESLSTNSSSSSRTYRGGAASSPWQQPDHLVASQFNHQPRPHYQEHTVEVMVDGPGRNTLLLHPPSSGPSAPTIVRYSTSSRACSDRDRPSTPASSPGGYSSGGRAAVDGCGGHCVAFETFCYYCLQVIFIAGVLTGISLMVAGSVLRSQQRGGDLLVLVYIGCLMMLVCALLLSVQCCVRRNVKRRKRILRHQRDRVGQRRILAQASNACVEIPMQDMSAPKTLPRPLSRSDMALQHQQQYQPLLMHIVQQQQTSSAAVTFDSLPQHQHHANNYRSGNTTDTSGFVGRMMDTSRSGTPWWRRNIDQPGVAESRH